MEQRERLIELLKSPNKVDQLLQMGVDLGAYYDDGIEAMIADFLLANGVIVAPCKVGDTVFGVVPKYDVTKGHVKYEVSKIEIKNLTYRLSDSEWTALLRVVDEKYEQCGTFGKTVFLTREEAEKALAERSGE